MTDWRGTLKSIYFDPLHPAAFAGPKKLHQIVKELGHKSVSLKSIRQFLQDEDAFSLHRPLSYKFKRNRVVTSGIDQLWDIDLADVSNIEGFNKNVRFLFILIDVFSRYLWVVPIPNKKHSSIVDGLKHIFASGRKPQTIRSDSGRNSISTLCTIISPPSSVYDISSLFLSK